MELFPLGKKASFFGQDNLELLKRFSVILYELLSREEKNLQSVIDKDDPQLNEFQEKLISEVEEITDPVDLLEVISELILVFE